MGKARVETLIFTLLFCFLGIINPVKGQNITKRVRVISGGSISFIFSTINDYNIGKVNSNWSRLDIYFIDTISNWPLPPGDGASTGWELTVRANQDKIYSDEGSLDLPLSTIEIIPSTIIPGTTVTPITLTDFDQTIITGSDPGATFIDGEITITYNCGTTTPLLGIEPEYYSVDLIFIIKELP
jgi:hypothetical protein